MKRYGVPYMGSKNFIASDIATQLPPAKHLYDLFAGGCAVTHAAMLTGKYERITANDTQDAPRLFKNAIEGKYRNECRWISREDFFALKDTDPYIKYCWSFGNQGTTYLYGRDIEELRHLQWQMCFADTPYKRKAIMRSVFQQAWNMGLIYCRDGDGNPPPIKGEPQSIQRLQSLQSLDCFTSYAGGV